MRFLTSILLWLCVLLASSQLSAQEPPQNPPPLAPGKMLTVGVKVAPPFVIADEHGYKGLAIDLWREVAEDHGWTYTYKEYDLAGLLKAVRDREVDVGLGAITATAEREQNMDFAHPIISSGLSVAVRKEGSSGWLAVVQALVSREFLSVIGLLVLLLLIVGVLVWAFERRRNPEHFGGTKAQGIFSGFWWAMVTMTTVGYGDTAPRGVPGRILGMLWMLTALIVVSFFTASITSALTVGKLSNQITSPRDLGRIRVASISGSTSGKWLDRNHTPYVGADSLESALADLAADRCDAVVYDVPLLAWSIRQRYQGQLRVLPFTLERQDYAFALPTASPLRESIDTSMLKRINSPDWTGRLKQYFGEEE